MEKRFGFGKRGAGTLVASYPEANLKTLADRLRAAGASHKAVITLPARKRGTIVNAFINPCQKWAVQTV
ncbi:hypothetical protein [Microbulbifer sp. S227A]|uniref:hypothetical protein n=1 Tax=Microbulbifer sp. S227A TaxID=3415131 RepID=UPI003C7AA9E9